MQSVEIRVQGRLDEHWSDWFDGLTITHAEHDETVLRGSVVDQAALYGVLSKLQRLGLPLVSVNTSDPIDRDKATTSGQK